MKPTRLSDLSVDKLVERLLEVLIRQDHALDSDDNRKYNRLFDDMIVIERELEQRPGDQRRALLPHLRHPNTQVRFMVATALWKLEPEAARAALQRIVDENDYPQAADARGKLMGLDDGRYVPE